MSHRFRFSVQAPEFSDRSALVKLAQSVEQLGYDELFTADHIGEADPFLPLIVAAEATQELRLGPLVLNNELHHPVLLARALATADQMTGGRIVLGIGTGYMRAEHDAAGIELREPRERVTRLEESLIVLRSLLDEGAASFQGVHHQVEIERSSLVQVTAVGDGADEQIQASMDRSGFDGTMIEQTPFLLMGSVEQVVAKVERLREDIGISHFVVRDAEGFAPVVEALT